MINVNSIKLFGNLIKSVSKAEQIEIDTDLNEIKITFTNVNVEVIKAIGKFVEEPDTVIGTINGHSLVALSYEYNFSQEVDEDGIPVSSTCKIKYNVVGKKRYKDVYLPTEGKHWLFWIDETGNVFCNDTFITKTSNPEWEEDVESYQQKNCN